MIPLENASLPDGVNGGPISSEFIHSTRLHGLLRRLGAVSIDRAVPRFDKKKIWMTSRTGRRVKLPDWSRLFRISFPTETSRHDALDSLNASGEVTYAEGNERVRQAGSAVYPNDLHFKNGNQWGLWQKNVTIRNDVRAPEAWAITTGSNAFKIGIIDRGIDIHHEDLDGRFANFDPLYQDAHGTQVAGVAAANANNGVGVAGVDWNTKIVSAQFSELNADNVLDALVYATQQNCDVINTSEVFNSGESDLNSLRIGYKFAYELNMVSVCVMGDACTEGPWRPGSFGQGIIAVGGTNAQGTKAGFSCTGGHIDVVAPGENITVCSTPGYINASGTSLSAPFVAGLSTLLLSENASLFNDDIENIIRLSADDLGEAGWDASYGTGRVNLKRAVDFLQAPNTLYHYAWLPAPTWIGSPVVVAPMQFIDVPNLSSLHVYYTKRYEVRLEGGREAPPAGFTRYVWGRQGAADDDHGWSDANPNFGMGWCDAVAELTTPTFTSLRTYVYEVWQDGPGGPYKGFFPCRPEEVQFYYTELLRQNTADLSQSYFVPEAGSVSAPLVGTDATGFFRGCPNNDGASYPNNARVRVVLKDDAGQPIPGVAASAIYILFNGGTPAQGFVGSGADSVIANTQYNPTCPDVRSIYADGPTNSNGVTYITFAGVSPGNPGIAVRDPLRKWGHYDTEIPVYVSGERLLGRFVEAQPNGSYRLQIKNCDVSGGLGTGAGGETVSTPDFNAVTSRIGQPPDFLSWWCDLNSDGIVNSTDFTILNGHLNHTCSNPLNP